MTGVKIDLIKRFQAVFVKEQKDDNFSDDKEKENEMTTSIMDVKTHVTNMKTDNEHRNTQRGQQESRILTFKDIEDLRTFDGKCRKIIDKWAKNFENAAKLCIWNNIQEMIYAKKLLRRSANVFVERKVRTETWKDLETALRKEFTRKVSARQVHNVLRRRMKRKDESYSEYYYKMLDIVSRMEIEEKILIEYIGSVNKFSLFFFAKIVALL